MPCESANNEGDAVEVRRAIAIGKALPLGSRKKTGAGEGIRTLDPDLGKVVLYP